MARDYQSVYAEEEAQLISLVNVPNANNRIAVRGWLGRTIPTKERQAVLVEMDTYTATKNTEPQRWVLNPSVSDMGEQDPKGQLLGVWRLVKNEIDPGDKAQKGIYQTLMQGYLQPPDWKADDDTKAAAWAVLDKEARILHFTENRTNDAKNIVGIVNYYAIIYPNVAQDAVSSFEAALTHRPDLDLTDTVPERTPSQPRFYSGKLPPATYRFVNAQNKPDEDGSSSDVIAILCDTKTPVNQEIQMVRNWQQYDWKRFYSGVPIIPVNMLPIDIPAVNVTEPPLTYPPTAGAPQLTQSTLASIYSVTGFSFDKESGLYHIEVTHKQAQSWWNVFTLPTLATGITQYEVTLINQTPEWVQGVLTAMGVAGLTCQMRIQPNEFKLFTGKIWPRTPSGNGHGEWAYTQKNCYQVTLGEEKYKDQIMRVATLTYWTESKGPNATNVRANLGDLGPGGKFDNLSGGWYFYKQVMYVYQAWTKNLTAIAMGKLSTPSWTNWCLLYTNPAAPEAATPAASTLTP